MIFPNRHGKIYIEIRYINASGFQPFLHIVEFIFLKYIWSPLNGCIIYIEWNLHTLSTDDNSLFPFIKFSGLTLVNKILQVSGARSTTQHVYTVWCVHRPSSSLLPSPCMLTILSSTSPRPSPQAITTHLFVSIRFFLSFSPFFEYFHLSYPHLPAVSLSLLCLLVHLSSYDCLISVSIMFFRTIQLPVTVRFPSF